MKHGYRIGMVYICPFIHLGGINIMPDLNYPARLCVIDDQRNYVIDIKTKLKYDYLETHSRLYIQSMKDKIKDNRRVAIPALLKSGSVFSKRDCNQGLKIIKELLEEKQFIDGNEVYSNEQYLEYLKEEELMELNQVKNNEEKVKKLGKRKK